jgi:cytochrome c1
MRRLGTVALMLVMTACGQANTHRQTQAAKQLIADHCGACHLVPGVPSATGRVGPSLAHIGQQQVIAGHFANTPALMSEWIEHPQTLLPGNVMPEMGLSHDQVRTIVDYLYTME